MPEERKKEKKAPVFAFAKFDLEALLCLAERLRNIPCSYDPSVSPSEGSHNWILFLSFKDGVEWVFRSPRSFEDTYMSPETVAKLIESEVATMKYIKLKASIPVPEIFDYSSTSSNPIGIPYVLMSKASGFPLGEKFAWNPLPEGRGRRRRPPKPSLERHDKEKIMRQLGEIASQLITLRFDTVGSLFEEDGNFSIKECLSPAFIWHERDALEDDLSRGPFQEDSSYYQSLVSALVLHAKELPLERSALFAPIPELREYQSFPSYLAAVDRWNSFVTIGSKVTTSKNRTDYCIAGHLLQKMIPLISQKPMEIPTDLKDGFALQHPDLSMGNICVDDDLNITCIIDWSFTSTVPIATLLAAPGMPHPRDELDPTLVPFFQSGFVDHYFKGKEVKMTSEFWDFTRKSWLLTRLVTLNDLQDYRYLTELYASVYPSEEVSIPKLFKELRKEEQFVELARTLAEDDDLSRIKRNEDDYFRCNVSDREAVARKLTLMTEMSEGFVADRRLWRWIEDALA